MKRYLVAIFEVPEDASVAETKAYIRSELMAAGGHYHPDDPLHDGVQTLKIKSERHPFDLTYKKPVYVKPLPDIT